jgi:hypothetical protein
MVDRFEKQNYSGVYHRDEFFQLFNWFQLFSYGEKLPKVAGRIQNSSKIDVWKGGVDYFSLIFSYFILFSNQNHPCYQDIEFFFFPQISTKLHMGLVVLVKKMSVLTHFANSAIICDKIYSKFILRK